MKLPRFIEKPLNAVRIVQGKLELGFRARNFYLSNSARVRFGVRERKISNIFENVARSVHAGSKRIILVYPPKASNVNTAYGEAVSLALVHRKREAHSAVQALSHPVYGGQFEEKIKQLRVFALEKLKGIKGIAIKKINDQASHIITLKVGSRERTKQIVDELKGRGVDIFHNMDWSIIEPKTPLLRISIGAKTSRKELEKFVKELGKIVR